VRVVLKTVAQLAPSGVANCPSVLRGWCFSDASSLRRRPHMDWLLRRGLQIALLASLLETRVRGMNLIPSLDLCPLTMG